MTSQAKTVFWNSQSGSILLSNNGAQERVILLRKGFWDEFFPEIIKVLGEDGVAVLMRNLVERVSLNDLLESKLSFRTLIECFNRRMMPISKEKSTIEPSVTWPKDDREITVFGDTVWILQDVFTIQQFKAAMVDLLDEHGTNAIIRNVCRRGGMVIGDTALKNYQWKDIDTVMASQDEKVYQYTFRVAGWSVARCVYQVGPDGNCMLLALCDNTFESDGVNNSSKPVCKILQNYMEGFYEGVLSKISDKSVECREVKCRSKGDGYCAFAFKMKEKGADPLDWDALEGEWRALDALKS